MVLLRRSHVVLTFILHFYVQSIPPTDLVLIPRSITLPLLRISKELDIPPILTYSDTVLYNWAFKSKPESRDVVLPELDNIRTPTTFTRSVDEEEFLLCSARIELRAVEILEMMRVTMDEIFLGDDTAVRRVTEHLNVITNALSELKSLFLNVKKLCDPDVYYNEVRPWYRGEDSSDTKRKWIFEGVEEDPELRAPTELSGPSAGQSSIIHAIDIFIGVDHQAKSPGQPSFMSRMQTYMPKNHRLFLNHLKTNPRPLRTFVMDRNDEALMMAFNLAVIALKEFRDAHMIIAALYILGPARRAAAAKRKLLLEVAAEAGVIHPTTPPPRAQPPKGTGGTDLVRFLKDTRDQTKEAVIQVD
jgi:indoleamine 2,3-dioxygenase